MISKTIGYNGVHNIFRHTHVNPVLGTTQKRISAPLSLSPSAREPARSRLPLPGHEAPCSPSMFQLSQQQIDLYTKWIWLKIMLPKTRFILIIIYISGWWFQPLWKMLVSWDDYSQYMEK